MVGLRIEAGGRKLNVSTKFGIVIFIREKKIERKKEFCMIELFDFIIYT